MSVKIFVATLMCCVIMHLTLYATSIDTIHDGNMIDSQAGSFPEVYCTVGWNTLLGLYVAEPNGRQPFFQNLTAGATFRWKTPYEQFQLDIGAILISSVIFRETQNKIVAFGRVTDIIDFQSYKRLYTLEMPLTLAYQIYKSGSNALFFRMGTSLGVGLYSDSKDKSYYNGVLLYEQKGEGGYPIPNNGFSLSITGGIEYQYRDLLLQVFYSRRTNGDFPRQLHLQMGYRIFR